MGAGLGFNTVDVSVAHSKPKGETTLMPFQGILVSSGTGRLRWRRRSEITVTAGAKEGGAADASATKEVTVSSRTGGLSRTDWGWTLPGVWGELCSRINLWSSWREITAGVDG
mmetsp:Transcript_10596/g.17274  ORF Transcript_10596/g.17274 Transcript_10596/m.17274 type:complete len:113 (+) Transcript_10596:1435-1773(+)